MITPQYFHHQDMIEIEIMKYHVINFLEIHNKIINSNLHNLAKIKVQELIKD
jgi:hypothetical protein